jgi:hypothetical protein
MRSGLKEEAGEKEKKGLTAMVWALLMGSPSEQECFDIFLY